MENSVTRSKGLLVIGVFKLIKSAALMVLAFGIYRLLHRDVQKVVEHWINYLRIDPHNHYVASLLLKLGVIDDYKIKELSGLTAIYSALLLVEGVGLLYQKRWAEYLTVIASALFLPVEIYEVLKHATGPRIALLVGNIAIVWYLIKVLRKGSESSTQHSGGMDREGPIVISRRDMKVQD